MAQILEGFHQTKLILLVGGELAPRHRHHFLGQLLPPPLGSKLLAIGRLLVPHGVGGPGLQPAEPAPEIEKLVVVVK